MPELSVVIAADTVATIRATLRSLHAHGSRARMELVVATLAGASIDREDPELAVFPLVHVVHGDDGIDVARAEARAVTAVTAPYVIFAESCAFARPGFIDAIAGACHSDAWDVVGPTVCNANPASATSWAGMQINYGRWIGGSRRGVQSRLPGHNSAYRRDALNSLGGQLPGLMQSLTAVQDQLRARGGLFYLEPSARVAILNISRPGWFLVDQFGKGQQFARLRRRGWPLIRSVLYAVGTPLTPVVRLARLVIGRERSVHLQDLARGYRCVILIAGLVATAAGEFVGYTTRGRAAAGFFERNLHRLRFVRPEERFGDQTP